MKLSIIFLFLTVASPGFGQTKVATFTVVAGTSSMPSPAQSHIKAVLPAFDSSAHINTLKIKFYPGSLKFVLNGEEGRLTWFSYTNPPRNKQSVNIEADQTSFGALHFRDTLYVCAPDRPQESLPVINELLTSVGADSLSEHDAQTVALLMAKCSDTVQVYGDPESTSESARRKMQKVASPPTASTIDGNIKVDFYSWSALPDDAISKWSFVFRANRLLSVGRIEETQAVQR